MLRKLVRFATAAAAVAVVGWRRAQAQSDTMAPDVLVKNVTLEVVDIIRKDKDIQEGGSAPRRR